MSLRLLPSRTVDISDVPFSFDQHRPRHPLAALEDDVPDERVLDLLRQYVRRTTYDGGLYEDVGRGISLGRPLSPLMGAFYLKRLDQRMRQTGLVYARFMDDWVILAPTRWKLRAAIRLVTQTWRNCTFSSTPTRPSSDGSAGALTSWAIRLPRRGWMYAPQTVERCVERVSRLYEQDVDLLHIGAYVRHGFGGQRADSGNAENDWLGLNGGSSDLSLADCGYASVVAVLRSLRLCPMT